MSGMLKRVAWLPLVLFPMGVVSAQDAPEVLPDNAVPPPPVDMITPVPAPEIPIGAPGAEDFKMPENLTIDNIGGGPISGSRETGIRYEGPAVKITGDNGLEIFADRLFWDLKAEAVTLEGNVSVYQDNTLQRGQKVVYHYTRKFLDTTGLRASVDPFLLESGKFTAEEINGKQVIVGRNAGITTDDSENPNYWIRSKETRIYPGEKVVFDDMRLYFGGTPVFWLPYLSQPLDGELGYHFIPGARSNWGPFLLNTYGIMLGGETDPATGENKDAWLLSRWHFDILSTRGLGTGVDFLNTGLKHNEEITGLSFYYLNDMNPDTESSGIPRGFVNEDRWKFSFKESMPLNFETDADWRIDSNLTWLSDGYYLEDFEPKTYRTNPQPDNTLGIYRRDDRSLLSILGRFRINDFYRADTRLPEVTFDTTRAPLFGLPLLHEGTTSLGFIGEKAPDVTRDAVINPLMGLSASDPAAMRLLEQLGGYERRLAESMLALPVGDPRREAIRTQLIDSSYTRFHTYQEFSLPMMVGGFLSIVPEAGGGYSTYSAVNGPEDNLDRGDLHVGTEVSVKFSKDLGDLSLPDWGLDGMMHVLQPYTNWSYVSTNDFEPGDPAVDRLTPTTRPRPLDPLAFTAIDEMNSWNTVRLGARNRLLTHRDGQTYEWFYLDTYVDGFLKDPEGSRDFSNLYNDVVWQPLPWLGVELETQFPIADGGSGFNEYATRIHYMPTDRFDFGIGYRYLSGHPFMLDSNRIDLETYTRLSENWGVGTQHILELDDSTLELQQYTVHRDLGNWVAGMGVSLRDNRVDTEYGVVFSLTLKDFPSVSLPFEIETE